MAFDLIARLRLVDNLSRPATSAIKTMGSLALKVSGVGVALGALAGGLGATAAAVKSMNKALDFEAEMSTIKALTGATAAQTKQMEDLALNMGSKTKYSALQAAQGIEELLKAGLTPAAVQAGGLEAALNLATAGGLELANAAEIMSTALNAYKKDGLTAAQAADMLAGTANASATSVEEMRYSLSAVSAVAAGIGMTFKDTNAALGLFANNGFKGSDAGTSLKTMIQNLQPGTKEQVALFNKLGITTNGVGNKFFTAGGKIESLTNISETLRKSLGKMTEMQRQATLEALFGTDAIRAANILYEEGAVGVKKFYDEMGNVTALQVATEKMNNGKGAIEQFKGAIETLQIRALKPLLPAVKSTFNALGEYVTNKTPQITAAMEKVTASVTKYVQDHFINNQEFRDLPLTAKVKFVFDSLREVFENWYNATGRSVITEYMTKITDTMVMSLQNSLPQLIDVGTTLGGGVAKGMFDGLMKNWDKTTVFGMLGSKIGIDIKESPFTALKNHFSKPDDSSFVGPPAPSGKAGGLDRVPYNGAVYALHKDERVQTKAEADEYRDNRRGGSGGVIVTGNTFHVRQESDIDAIAKALATQAWEARMAVVR